MAIIGTFTRSNDDYSGKIQTLTVNVTATIKKVDVTSEKAPDYRITAGGADIGAGWTKTSRDGKEYVSVKLDDPTFPAPVFANLHPQDDGYALIWSR